MIFNFVYIYHQSVPVKEIWTLLKLKQNSRWLTFLDPPRALTVECDEVVEHVT